MDGCDLESGHWLHQDQPRLQALLCRTVSEATQGNGAGKLPQRFRDDAAASDAGIAASLEKTKADLRQLDERPLSHGRSHFVHQTGVRRHDASPLASVSGFDQTV